MIRKITGIVHVGDLEYIKDANIRNQCEITDLKLAKHLMVN